MDLGVYVFAKNEENLIVPCVSAIRKVFPQVEVIDLGSEDSTLEKLSSLNCKVRNISCTPEEYPHLKNSVGKEHGWAFFIDGDEIYPEEQLRKIEPLIESRQHRGYRISWRYVHLIDGQKYFAKNLASNVIKIYRSDRFTWVNAWPWEAMENRKREKTQPKDQQNVWCWHGRFLKRTSIVDSVRDKKMEDTGPLRHYEKHYGLVWEKTDKFAWEE